MMMSDFSRNLEGHVSEAFESLLAAILKDDRPAARKLLETHRELSSGVVEESRLYETEVAHWLYAGDTALHLAAAGYRVEIAQLLLASGADPNFAQNHRVSGPLHYASDGYINGPTWNEERQVKTIRCLLEAGVDANAQDKNGAAPLHRAVRTRCIGAVRCLFDAGCSPTIRNKAGSTPFHLAVQTTGRGGSGEEEAKNAQRAIIMEFLSRGVNMRLKDGKGKSVVACANSDWIRDLLVK